MTTEGSASTEDSQSTRSRTFAVSTVATVGVIFVLLGLVHTIAGLPLVLKAVEDGGINLPSIEDTGVRFQLLREPVVYGILSLGVDRCVFGVILILCVPELKKGNRLAWRICMAIGMLFVFGYTPLICIVFERANVPALVMPAFGLVIVVVLLVGRRGFSVT